MPAKRRRHAGRSGAVALETLILIPILLALTLAVIEFGLLLANQAVIDSAAAQAVRVAARSGSEKEIAQTVAAVLGKGRYPHADVFVTSANPDESPLRTGDLVEVRVEIVARNIVPNLLAFIGVSLGERKLTGHAVLRME